MEKEFLRIPGKGEYSDEARRDRIEFLEKARALDLSHLQNSVTTAESLKGNIENYIGQLSIPVGVAGPLAVHFQTGSENIFVPVATTEGALVASISRGARAITASGGLKVRALSQRMLRAPLFNFENLEEAFQFATWLRAMTPQIKLMVPQFSSYAELTEIEIKQQGRTVNTRFVYKTKDAAGQNMTTLCTWNLCRWILAQTKKKSWNLDYFLIEGGLATDKKVSYSSALLGRGTEVTAEAVITHEVMKSVLKTTATDVVRGVSLSKAGMIHSGQHGWNVNVANVVAAIFAATGQDLACVHESSLGEIHVETQDSQTTPGEKDLYISLYMPALIVGTVGGGTRLESQAQFLSLLGCDGAGKAGRLAEIICGFALALDLSTMSAMANQTFAQAHEALGRKFSKGYRKKSEITNHYLQATLFPNSPETVFEDLGELTGDDSMIMEMSSQVTQKLCGFHRYGARNVGGVSEFILKVKPLDKEVILASEMMAGLCDESLLQAYRATSAANPFVGNHERELLIHEVQDEVIQALSPRYVGVLRDSDRQFFALAQEYVAGMQMKRGASSTEEWSKEKIETALKKVASLHARFLNKDLTKFKLKNAIQSFGNKEHQDLFHQLVVHKANNFSDWYTREMEVTERAWAQEWVQTCQSVQHLPMTLIHNDFNSRNLNFKAGGELVVFDWELACQSLPQRDLVEFLAFTTNENTSATQIKDYVALYKKELEKLSGFAFAGNDWKTGLIYSVRELALHRLGFYSVAHSFKNCVFLSRVYQRTHSLDKVFEAL